MNSPTDLETFLPKAIEWVRKQEAFILANGIALTDDQKIDAYLAGVQNIEKIRIWYGKSIPVTLSTDLEIATQILNIISSNSQGTSFRYGIYLNENFKGDRNLLIHEFAHTMQYERMGTMDKFLAAYLEECITYGYPNGPLEQEARSIETKICCD